MIPHDDNGRGMGYDRLSGSAVVSTPGLIVLEAFMGAFVNRIASCQECPRPSAGDIRHDLNRFTLDSGIIQVIPPLDSLHLIPNPPREITVDLAVDLTDAIAKIVAYARDRYSCPHNELLDLEPQD